MIDFYVGQTCKFSPSGIPLAAIDNYTYSWQFDNQEFSVETYYATNAWKDVGVKKVTLTITDIHNTTLSSVYEQLYVVGLKYFPAVSESRYVPVLRLTCSGIVDSDNFYHITHGNMITLTATMSSGVTGFISFFRDAHYAIGGGELDSFAQASIESLLSTGRHIITAEHIGNETFYPCLGNKLFIIVDKKTPTIVLEDSQTDHIVGNTESLRVLLPGDATGTVSFYDNNVIIGVAYSVTNGRAYCDTVLTETGIHVFKAVYSGNDDYNSATSNQLEINALSYSNLEITEVSGNLNSYLGQMQFAATLYYNTGASAGDVTTLCDWSTDDEASVSINQGALATSLPITLTKTITITATLRLGLSNNPRILVQPTDSTIEVGSVGIFHASAGGAAPLSYQWYLAGVPVATANALNYTTPIQTAAGSLIYTLRVQNAYGVVVSRPTTLTIHERVSVPAAPIITAQPSDQEISIGSNGFFGVSASGTEPLIYRWYLDNIMISGATSSTYTTPTQNSIGSQGYKVSVQNAFGIITSDTATLTVQPSTEPNLPPSITLQPLTQTIGIGTSCSFVVSATGTSPLYYQWSKNGIAITGASSSNYVTPVQDVAGVSSYRVRVYNDYGTVNSSLVYLTVDALPTAPVITAHPSNQSIEIGGTGSFSVSFTGTPPFTYLWYLDGSPINNSNSLVYVTPVQASTGSKSYSVKIQNAQGMTVSNAAILTITGILPNIITQPISQMVHEGTTVSLVVTASGTGLTYQWKKDRVSISGASQATLALTNVTYGTDNGSYTCLVLGEAGSVTSDIAYLTIQREYSFTTSAVGRGTITPSSFTYWDNCPTTTVLATPDPGFSLLNIMANGIPTGGRNPNGTGGFSISGISFTNENVVAYFSTPADSVSISNFSIIPASITPGVNTATLTWVTANSTSVTIDHGIGVVNSSDLLVLNPSVTTTYTLTAEGQGGPITAQATLSVTDSPIGWHIFAGGSLIYDTAMDIKLSIFNENAYPVTNCLSVLWMISQGDSPTPDPLNPNWLYDYKMPPTPATVTIGATINMPGGHSYTMSSIQVQALGIGDPRFAIPLNASTDDGLNYNVTWMGVGAVSGYISVTAMGSTILDYPNSGNFNYYFNPLTWVYGACTAEVTLYGGPNLTGNVVSQTIELFDYYGPPGN